MTGREQVFRRRDEGSKDLGPTELSQTASLCICPVPRVVLGPGLTNIICVCISIDSREREGRQLGKSRTPEAYGQSDIRGLESKGGMLWEDACGSHS